MQREDLKNLLNSFKEEDFYRNVDLHIHSYYSDGEMTTEQVIEQAKAQNMKYISICDHNCIDAYLNSDILSNPIVIPSVEFDCFYKGVLIHILGYGIDVNNSDLAKFYADNKNDKTSNFHRILKLRNPKKVIEAVKKAGGIPVLAHPCCCWAINLDGFVQGLVKFGLEGLEVYYKYKGARGVVKFHPASKVFKIAEKYNLIKTGGTDSHGMKLLK